MIDPVQLRDLVRRTLVDYNLHSAAAEELVLGTIAQESRGGTYIRQIKGPALGIAQVEPATYRWLRRIYGKRFDFATVPESHLEWDLRLSILVCRLRYLVDPEPLAHAKDLEGLARQWKRIYNTRFGKGTEAEFIASYCAYVAEPRRAA